MQDIFLLGLNHKTAPIEIRECLAFSAPEAAHAMASLRQHAAIREVILFSTCNRVEILFVARESDAALAAVKAFLSDYKKVPGEKFEESLYLYCGSQAVEHVFRVAASLDSMMVGEPQILGQTKAAFRAAAQEKSTGVILNRLLHRTFWVAKRIRSETGIGDHAVSISYAAIELGRKIFGTLEDKKVLLIGAGEMAELAVEHLIRNRAAEILVANRTFSRAVELADRYRGQAIRFEEISEALGTVDIIISSTGATEFVILPAHVKAVMRSRKNRPLFFIDIAVPRDIDPAINRITNVYVYDIDDLKGVVDENIEDRSREAVKAERLVDEAVIQFRKWYESLHVIPTIVALRQKLDGIIDAEINRTLQGHELLGESDREGFSRMKTAIINKIMHHPTLFLKRKDPHGDIAIYLDAIRRLFELDEES
ncbi:MAG: glutamyl-tRNA reductase [Pseudomonadota bacterium]